MASTSAASAGPDKRALFLALIAAVEADLEVIRASAAAASEGATHEEAKPENDKDTRALEQSYLAGAQAGRARLLQGQLSALRLLSHAPLPPGAAALTGALVAAEEDDARALYLLSPCGGGALLPSPEGPVRVLSPDAPLGAALLGAQVGDWVELRAGGRLRELEIVGVW